MARHIVMYIQIQASVHSDFSVKRYFTLGDNATAKLTIYLIFHSKRGKTLLNFRVVMATN